VREKGLTQTDFAEGSKFQRETQNESAALRAFMRIATEHRRTIRLLHAETRNRHDANVSKPSRTATDEFAKYAYPDKPHSEDLNCGTVGHTSHRDVRVALDSQSETRKDIPSSPGRDKYSSKEGREATNHEHTAPTSQNKPVNPDNGRKASSAHAPPNSRP